MCPVFEECELGWQVNGAGMDQRRLKGRDARVERSFRKRFDMEGGTGDGLQGDALDSQGNRIWRSSDEEETLAFVVSYEANRASSEY